jgi:hypothetical protein
MCGRPDVDAFLDELSFAQIDELNRYFEIEGTEQERNDWRWAWGMSVLCRKFGVDANPDDFVAYHADNRPKEATPEAKRLAMMLNTRPEVI